MKEIRILYLTAEEWPTFRVDLTVLFGQELAKLGVSTHLVTELKPASSASPWSAGDLLLCPGDSRKHVNQMRKFWHLVTRAWSARASRVDAIQVRDMPVVAFFAYLAARVHGIKFFYWMSYPQSEGQIDRARRRGVVAGLKYWLPLIQGLIGRWILYRVVLRVADHVFVQSDRMKEDVAKLGVKETSMTAVPMGVDVCKADPSLVPPSDDPRLNGREVIVYLGTLDATRNIDCLVRSIDLIRQKRPEALLVLVGDADDVDQRAHIRKMVTPAVVAESVWWTGWVPMDQAWRIVRSASVAVSPFPRGYLLDSASPTKAMEYLALGVPVVVNDNPDQKEIVEASGSGLCVPYTDHEFASAILEILDLSPQRRIEMGMKGRAYVTRHRSYQVLAKQVRSVYDRLI